MNESAKPLSLEELVALINKAFEESKYPPEERITAEELKPVYDRVTDGYDIYGLRPTTNDPNVRSLLSWLPNAKSGKIVVASLRVSYQSGPGDFVPCDVPMCYLVIDFEEKEILTEYEAYSKYKNKKKNLA